jgi:dihydrofolate reductase
MRRVILQEFVSVNGSAADSNGGVDFVPASTEGDRSLGQRQMEFIDSIDTILLGRVTYELFVNYWPKVTSGEDKAFADKLNGIPKVVFSKTLTQASWGEWQPPRVVGTSATEEVTRLKQQSGKDMVIWGSLSLAQSLIDDKLVDEYQLIVCPIVLAGGRPLFHDRSSSIGMKLVKTQAFDRGAVLLAYEATF